ncbi:MAG TPA: beta-L-arabinofuranosidase domain-containing protein [Steroidobacteraceae bacterium]|nr:beta-L-arabinofuranosidase domain-containing protein [Steroidobacteraceae bacterium]
MSNHSRRDAMKLLGAGAATTLSGLSTAHAATSMPSPPGERYFRLTDVRLKPGPFLDAQKLDEAYLLRLEPDRMLANFRTNAGLEPRAPVYGGWESVEPWIWIRCHGHTLGHYLTAASCMYESTEDTRFADRVAYIVVELMQCQKKTGGWLTAFPDGVAPLTDSLAGKEFAGVPWYTTHKVLAGLRDAWLHTGLKNALDVAVRFADWIDRACADVPEDRFQKMLDREHGGMNEVLADLSALTGDRRYEKLAMRFCHHAILAPLARGEDRLDGLHANTQIPKVIGFSRLADLTGKPEYRRSADYFWEAVTTQRSFATGGHGDVEHFFPKNEFAKHVESGKTMETCCTHNMLRLTRSLYGRSPAADYYDYFERALFNGILASQDPESGMNTYFQSTRPGYVRLYHTPFDSFWCCTGSGLENHARYGEAIYARDRDTLFVNLFIASTLQWREAGVVVEQDTRFPDSDTTRLTIRAEKAREFTLSIRQPAWCPAMPVTVNGSRTVVSRKPGRYHQLRRRFHPGDVIEVRIPMSLRLETLPNSLDQAALVYGPIVLAGRLGTEGLKPGSQLIVNERESGNMLQADVKVPRWTQPLEALLTHTTRTNPDKLEFRTSGFAEDTSVDLIPWFRLTHERYNLYWRARDSS